MRLLLKYQLEAARIIISHHQSPYHYHLRHPHSYLHRNLKNGWTGSGVTSGEWSSLKQKQGKPEPLLGSLQTHSGYFSTHFEHNCKLISPLVSSDPSHIFKQLASYPSHPINDGPSHPSSLYHVTIATVFTLAGSWTDCQEVSQVFRISTLCPRIAPRCPWSSAKSSLSQVREETEDEVKSNPDCQTRSPAVQITLAPPLRDRSGDQEICCTCLTLWPQKQRI